MQPLLIRALLASPHTSPTLLQLATRLRRSETQSPGHAFARVPSPIDIEYTKPKNKGDSTPTMLATLPFRDSETRTVINACSSLSWVTAE